MMKKFSHKPGWVTDINTSHVEPPAIPLIKEIFTGISDGDDVKLKKVEILCLVCRTFMNLLCFYFTMAIQKSFFFSIGISLLIL